MVEGRYPQPGERPGGDDEDVVLRQGIGVRLEALVEKPDGQALPAEVLLHDLLRDDEILTAAVAQINVQELTGVSVQSKPAYLETDKTLARPRVAAGVFYYKAALWIGPRGICKVRQSL